MNRIACFAAGFLMAAAVSSAASASLIVNGSFEESALNPGGTWIPLPGGSTAITGWTTLLGGVDYMGPYWAPADGIRSIDLNNVSQGGIAQSFATIVGAKYSVTFALSANMEGGPAEKIVMVSAGSDSAIFTFDYIAKGATLADPKWEYFEWTFTADSAMTTLSFISQIGGAFGPALDDVAVIIVPAPGSVALLALGLMAGRRRRR